MRNPNGYGGVVKLHGRRRNPYCVRIGCKYVSDGERLKEIRTVLGCYPTRAEALNALAEYNRSPYEVTRKSTFAEIYEKWLREKQHISKSRLKQYGTAFHKCYDIHNRYICDLRLYDFQAIIDRNTQLSAGSLANIKQLISGVCKYAMRYDLIIKDYSDYIMITDHAAPTEMHRPFTEQEIADIWNDPPSLVRDMTLILLYSGWRISELLELDSIDLTEQIMVGGMKTKAGKGRTVPIHHRIAPLVAAYADGFHISDQKYRDAVKLQYNHLPHDTRHTFISRLQSAGADHVCIERIVGHASKSVTDRVYTHKDVEELRRTVELLK